MEKLLEAKQVGGGTVQQPVFGGTVCVTCSHESIPPLLQGTGFAERTG